MGNPEVVQFSLPCGSEAFSAGLSTSSMFEGVQLLQSSPFEKYGPRGWGVDNREKDQERKIKMRLRCD